MFMLPYDGKQIVIYLDATLTDPAHQIRFACIDSNTGLKVFLFGTRWQRLLIWLLTRAMKKYWVRNMPG